MGVPGLQRGDRQRASGGSKRENSFPYPAGWGGEYLGQSEFHLRLFCLVLEGLQHWEDVQNGGDGWKVEELPGDFGKDFPKGEVQTYFVSSFE